MRTVTEWLTPCTLRELQWFFSFTNIYLGVCPGSGEYSVLPGSGRMSNVHWCSTMLKKQASRMGTHFTCHWTSLYTTYIEIVKEKCWWQYINKYLLFYLCARQSTTHVSGGEANVSTHAPTSLGPRCPGFCYRLTGISGQHSDTGYHWLLLILSKAHPTAISVINLWACWTAVSTHVLLFQHPWRYSKWFWFPIHISCLEQLYGKVRHYCKSLAITHRPTDSWQGWIRK